MFPCNSVRYPSRVHTLDGADPPAVDRRYSTPLRASWLSITHNQRWTTAGNHRHGTDGHMVMDFVDFDTCRHFGNRMCWRLCTCTIHDHIRQLSSHERRVTCQWCHMGAHPRHYNTPPIGAHPRGRLLDGARATFTDHASTPEDQDVYHRHAPCVATAPAKATILLGHFCSLPHGPGHTELCIMLARA